MSVIKIRGVLLDIYFVTTYKKGEKLIIVQCVNFIYGTMVANLLYYNKFVKTLKRTGFRINSYDPCVENILINYKHRTICFHVDGCNLRYQYIDVNDEFINTLRGEYEIVFEDGSRKIKVIQGKLHD